MESPIAVPRRVQHAGEGRRVGVSRHTTRHAIKLRNTPPSQRRPKRTTTPTDNKQSSSPLVPTTRHNQEAPPPPVNNSSAPLSSQLETPLSPVIGSSNFATLTQSLLRPYLMPTAQAPTTARVSSPTRISPGTSDRTKKRQLQEESEEEEVLSPPLKTRKPLATPNHVNKMKDQGKAKKQKRDKAHLGASSKKSKAKENTPKESTPKAKKKKPTAQAPLLDESVRSDDTSETIEPPDEQSARANTTQARRRIALGRNDQVLECVLDKIFSTTDEYMEEEDCSDVQSMLDIWKDEITSSFEEYQAQARENSALSRNLKSLLQARKELRREILAAKKELYNAQQAIVQEEVAYRKSEAERISKENLHAFLTNFDILLQTPLSEKSQTQVVTDNVESFLVTVADNGHNLSRVRAINQTLQDCSSLLDILASM